MKTAAMLPALALLTLAASAGASDFGLNLISAGDIPPVQLAMAEPAPVAELSAIPAEEASAYLADREADEEGATAKSAPGAAGLGGDGSVKLYHQWTRETLELRYRDERGAYLPAAMAQIRHFMRCRLTGKEADISPALIEIIDALQDRHGGRTVTVICGYRSPELNGALASGSGAVAKNSLHMRGWAADIKIDGVRTSALRDSARALRAGGVGYYPADGFVHVDTGAVRYW